MKSGVGRRVGWVAAADCRGRGRAEAGWGGERGSWVCEVEARGNGQVHRAQGVGARAPGGQKRTWLPSCGDG